ncbi:MAG: glycosyltransferase [Prevotella sp.]|jgi:glycosyltransferase involved in cell wall biosynthesis|nr:glycosyltransferase [Prevotella sp.]
MERNPLVSICVPVYNVEKYISTCVKSLLGQTYDNIEFIFVDDGSTDKSLNLLKKLLSNYDRNAQIIENMHNRGLSVVRNIALKYVHGDFILWVDSDDQIDLETVEKLIKKQSEADYDIVTYDILAHYKNHDEKIVSPDFSSPQNMTITLLSRRAPVCVCGRFIRFSLYQKENILSLPDLNCGEDYQVSARLAFFARRVGNLHECLYHYNCTNQDSYTYHFSVDRCEQEWKSIFFLEDFFKGKGECYSRALDRGKLEMAAHHIAHCCQWGNRTYYFLIRKRISSINKELGADLPLYLRLCLKTNNYNITYLYVKIAMIIRNLLR